MAQCIDCEFYISAEETGDEPGCMNDGDVSNPLEDIYCATIDGEDVQNDNAKEKDKEEKEEKICEKS